MEVRSTSLAEVKLYVPKRVGDARGYFSEWYNARSLAGAGLDRGFVLSDHADWPGLLAAIRATGCERVVVTHGDEALL